MKFRYVIGWSLYFGFIYSLGIGLFLLGGLGNRPNKKGQNNDEEDIPN